jgi:hydroxyacylglutathione hydrolase
MRVISVPVLKDNFSYLIIEGGYAAVVDPGECPPVESALQKEGVTLGAIWLTHHHWDHVGGVDGLAKPGVEVIAHESDASRAPKVTRTVKDGDTVDLGSLKATIIHNPGHTLGAISYLIDGCVFTGDTLFGGGCGRVFEGTMEMMHASLQRLAALPTDTRVYFGHEYTASNLEFAAHVEPDNVEVATRARALPSPSTPSTIALERATNPFLRVTNAAEFAARRTAKDTFKG